MATTAVPTLSSSGWKLNVNEKLDSLMSDFFCSNYDQTVIFKGQVTSLPYIVQQNYTNEANLALAIRNALMVYFSKYFDEVDVESIGNRSEDGKITVTISARVTQDGESYSVAKSLVTNGSKIQAIMDFNNG